MKYEDFLLIGVYCNICNVIYKFTNLINNKVYIGQTTQSVRTRVIQHIADSKSNRKSKTYFHNALSKYGFDNFTFEIIEYCQDKQQLNEKEIYWIGYYKSNIKQFGYNLTPGGPGNTDRDFCKKNIDRLIKANTGRSLSDETKRTISISNKNNWNNSQFRAKHIEHVKEMWEITSNKVVQLDYNYNLINTYPSQQQVSIMLYGKSSGTFSRNLSYKDNKINGFKKNGFIWMRLEDYLKRKRGAY